MNGKTTYQAKIIKPDGLPLEATNVNFKFSVLDTVGSCVLYSETYSAINMTATGGLISFALGGGTRAFPPASATTAIFSNVFDNSITSMPCEPSGIYNPLANDTRRIVMQFNDGGGWQTLPAMTINAVPYAIYATKANNAKTLNGKSDSAFVENATLAALNCNSATHAITFNGASFSCIPVGSDSGGITGVTTSGSVLVTGGTASAPVISITAATMSSDGYLTAVDYAEFKAKLSVSSAQIVNTLGYAPVSSSAVATQINNSNLSGDVSGTISSNSVVSVGGKTSIQVSNSVDDTLAATASATADTIVKRNALGNAIFNDIYTSSAKLNYVDIYKPSTAFNIRLQAPTSLSADYTLNLPTTSGTTGQVLSTDGLGNLSWINSATGSVTSVSGAANEITATGGSTPTLGLTNTGTPGTYYKVITDSKGRVTSGATTLTLSDLPTSVLDTASSFSGDISGMIANITVNRIQGVSVTVSSLTSNDILQYDGSKYLNKNIPSCSGNQYLTFNGTSFLCVADAGASGTITTISVTGPISSTGGSNPTLSIAQANTTTDGYLSSTDFNTFNNKQNATSAAIIATLGYTPATSTTLAASFVQKAGDTMTGLLNLPTNGLTVGSNQLVVSGSNVGIGALNPTAALQLKAGTTTNAPLKFTSGTLLSSAQSGTIEYDGAQLYFTDGASVRRALATNSGAGSFDNTSSISNLSGNITLAPSNITGSVIVNSAAASISSGTGALVVNGGVGITGSINAGGNLNLSGSATIDQSLSLPSLTSGSLLFAGTGGLVSEDNSQLFWDGANKRLGLGITTPVTKLDVSGGVRISMESATCATSYAGTLRYNAGNVEYCNGISWSAFGLAGAGITTINGSTSGTQSFANNLTGTTPAFTTANGVHTLNIPYASVGATTAGLLSNADYTIFNSKQNATSAAIITTLGYTPADNAASGTYLQRTNNLSDLNNPTSARANLGLGSLAVASSIDLGSASATGTLAMERTPAYTGDVTKAAASNTLILSNSGVTAGTYNKVTVDAKGRVTSSSALVSADVTTALGYTPVSAGASTQWTTSGSTISYNTGNVGIGTTTPVTSLDVSGGVRISMESASCAANYAGTLRYNSGNVEYCNGTSWSAFGLAGAGITTINGSTSATQSFANNLTGTTPAFTTANGVHTLNIPYASVGATTAGLISNADYITFNNKVTSSAASIVQVLGYTPADNATALTASSGLLKANNLSDLASSTVARLNLGLGYVATLASVDLGSPDVSGTLAIERIPAFIGDATVASASNTIILSNTGVTAGTYAKVTVDAKGRVTSSSALSSSDVTTALGYTPSNSTSGVTSLNGLTSQMQTFAVGVTGTSFEISSAGSNHSFNIPLAASSSVVAGLLSNADYTTFNSKQNATSAAIITTLGYTPADNAASGTYLQRTNNLSDLNNPTSARANLGLGSLAVASSIDLGSASATGTLAIERIPAFIGDATVASASNTIILSNTGVTAGTYAKVTVDAKGRVTSSSALSSSDVTTALGYTPSNSTSGVTSLNGLTSQIQTFAVGVTGTSFAISSAGSNHSFNIPLAASSSVVAGLLSNADYTTFNSKQNATSAAIITTLGYTPADNATALTASSGLLKANNLSDLASSTVARLNLGLGYVATLASVDLGSPDVSGTLAIERTPAYTGDVTKAAASNTLILSNSGVTAGTYAKVTVDAKGRVTSSSALLSADVTTALGYTPVSAGASNQWTTSGSTISYNTGNVGIGTTSPGSPMTVAGTVESTSGGFKFPDGRTVASAPSTPLMGNAIGQAVGPGTAMFAALSGVVGLNSSEVLRSILIPKSGTIKNFYLVTNGSQPATGSLVATIRKNGVDTAVTLTVSASAVAGTYSDTTNSFEVSAGDLISVRIFNNASGGSAGVVALSAELQ